MTRTYVLPVEVQVLEDGRFLAVCPTLEGCHAEGDTIAEALENVEDMARIAIEFSLEKGLPLPRELQGKPPPKVRAEMVVSVER
jgi:predicted RNase H-like HicB family nuclease